MLANQDMLLTKNGLKQADHFAEAIRVIPIAPPQLTQLMANAQPLGAASPCPVTLEKVVQTNPIRHLLELNRKPLGKGEHGGNGRLDGKTGLTQRFKRFSSGRKWRCCRR